MTHIIKQSGWQQKYNDGNLGFFPTSDHIVEMEMNLIDFSHLSSNAELTIADFSGGTGEQLKAMQMFVEQKGLNAHAFYNELNHHRFSEAKAKYGDHERFNLCYADFMHLCCQHRLSDNRIQESVMTIIRNNPPYTLIDFRGTAFRAEEIFSVRNAVYNAVGGIQILEAPLYQLKSVPAILDKFCARYEDVRLFKFPEPEFSRFGQVVVIGVKRESISPINDAAALHNQIHSESIPSLSDVKEAFYTLSDAVTKRSRIPTIFRDNRQSEATLSAGMESVLRGLMAKDKIISARHKNVALLDGKPIIERTVGHRALELNAGKFNGIMGNVLVEGGSVKCIEEVEDFDASGRTITEIEKIYPFVEITNRNGDLLIKQLSDISHISR